MYSVYNYIFKSEGKMYLSVYQIDAKDEMLEPNLSGSDAVHCALRVTGARTIGIVAGDLDMTTAARPSSRLTAASGAGTTTDFHNTDSHRGITALYFVYCALL